MICKNCKYCNHVSTDDIKSITIMADGLNTVWSTAFQGTDCKLVGSKIMGNITECTGFERKIEPLI